MMDIFLGRQATLLKGLCPNIKNCLPLPTDNLLLQQTQETGHNGNIQIRESIVFCNTWSELAAFYYFDTVKIPNSSTGFGTVAAEPAETRDALALFPDKTAAEGAVALNLGISQEVAREGQHAFVLVALHKEMEHATMDLDDSALADARGDIERTLLALHCKVLFLPRPVSVLFCTNCPMFCMLLHVP